MSQNTTLFDSNGKPTSELIQLLELMDVRHNGMLPGIRDATQDAWYQKGKIRAEIREKHDGRKEELLPLFTRLGMVDAIQVTSDDLLADSDQSAVLVLGALVTAVRKRYVFARSNAPKNRPFFFLGSSRPLLEREHGTLYNPDNPELPYSRERLPAVTATDEIDMMCAVAQQIKMSKDSPQIIVVNTPDKDGKPAITEDTVRHWKLLFAHKKGAQYRLYAVSSQPYVSFQHRIVSKILPPEEGFDVVTIGYGAPEATNVSQYLDNVAKCIYEDAIRFGFPIS